METGDLLLNIASTPTVKTVAIVRQAKSEEARRLNGRSHEEKKVAPMEVWSWADCSGRVRCTPSGRGARKLGGMWGSRTTLPPSQGCLHGFPDDGKARCAASHVLQQKFVNTVDFNGLVKFEALTRLFKAHSLRLKPVVIMGEWLEPLRLLESSWDSAPRCRWNPPRRKHDPYLPGGRVQRGDPFFQPAGLHEIGCNLTGPKSTPYTIVFGLGTIGTYRRPASGADSTPAVAGRNSLGSLLPSPLSKHTAEKYGSKWICRKRCTEP